MSIVTFSHEPCASRGECYHAHAGRIGGRNQPHEAKVRGGRIGGRNQPHEAKVRGGRNQSREDKARGGRNQSREDKARGARRRNELYENPATPEGRAKGGHRSFELYGNTLTPESRAKGGRIGARITAEKLRKRPNNGEATVAALLFTFAPDVFADTIWLRGWKSGGLRGVPDLRHPTNVVGEYDGGGHHVFKNRHADDALKDAERRAAGYTVIRETDPYILVAKFRWAVRRNLGERPTSPRPEASLKYSTSTAS